MTEDKDTDEISDSSTENPFAITESDGEIKDGNHSNEGGSGGVFTRRNILVGGGILATGYWYLSSRSRGPTEAVKQYFEGLREGNAKAINEVLHPESPSYPAESSGGQGSIDATVIETQVLSPSEATEYWNTYPFRRPGLRDLNGNEIEKEWEERANDIGVNAYKLVLVTFEEDGNADTVPFPVVKDNGDWYVYAR
jgi:hypothetical protein